MSLRGRLLIGILALPVNVLIVVPAILLWATAGTAWSGQAKSLATWTVWLGGLFCAGGLVLMVWTVADFFRVGEGTPAPWDPPRHLVVKGPYRYVRNPMISGVIMVLFGETLITDSWALAALLGVFVLGNAIYLPLIEERALEKRFGDAYRQYKANVPRWLPRPTPWSLPPV